MAQPLSSCLHLGFGVNQVQRGNLGRFPGCQDNGQSSPLFPSAVLGHCKSIGKLYHIDRMKGRRYGVFFPLPCGQIAIHGYSKEVDQRKKRKSQWGSGQFGHRQACMQEGQRLARRGVTKTQPEDPRDSPNCAAVCQCISSLCPRCAREITIAGMIPGAIIPVINTPPTVGVEVVSNPIHGLFCFRFPFPHRAGGLSVMHRIVKITNSTSCPQQKVAQNY